MSNINFICPTCKRPTHQTDNEIIEYLAKEKDRYRDILGERTKELERTLKALDLAIDTINKASDALIGCQEADDKYISDITAEDGLELLSEALGKIRFLQKEVK